MEWLVPKWLYSHPISYLHRQENSPNLTATLSLAQ